MADGMNITNSTKRKAPVWRAWDKANKLVVKPVVTVALTCAAIGAAAGVLEGIASLNEGAKDPVAIANGAWNTTSSFCSSFADMAANHVSVPVVPTLIHLAGGGIGFFAGAGSSVTAGGIGFVMHLFM